MSYISVLKITAAFKRETGTTIFFLPLGEESRPGFGRVGKGIVWNMKRRLEFSRLSAKRRRRSGCIRQRWRRYVRRNCGFEKGSPGMENQMERSMKSNQMSHSTWAYKAEMRPQVDCAIDKFKSAFHELTQAGLNRAYRNMDLGVSYLPRLLSETFRYERELKTYCNAFICCKLILLISTLSFVHNVLLKW